MVWVDRFETNLLPWCKCFHEVYASSLHDFFADQHQHMRYIVDSKSRNFRLGLKPQLVWSWTFKSSLHVTDCFFLQILGQSLSIERIIFMIVPSMDQINVVNDDNENKVTALAARQLLDRMHWDWVSSGFRSRDGNYSSNEFQGIFWPLLLLTISEHSLSCHLSCMRSNTPSWHELSVGETTRLSGLLFLCSQDHSFENVSPNPPNSFESFLRRIGDD